MTGPRRAVVRRAVLSCAVPLVATVLLWGCAGPGGARRASPSAATSTSTAGSGKTGPSGAPVASSEHQPRSAGLSAAAIRAVVGTHAKALEACYEHELQDRLKLEGILVIRLAVNPDGTVSHPRVDEASKIPASDPLSRCVLDLVTGWRFPKPAAGDDVELVLPFAFRPKAPPPSPQAPPAPEPSGVRTPPPAGVR